MSQLFNKKSFFSQALTKFLGVGLLNTIVGYAIYALLILLNMQYLPALLIATIAGVTFNYFSIGKIVFKSKGGIHVLAKFVSAYGVVYVVNAGVLALLIRYFLLSPYVGQVLCVPLSVILSWLLMNYWVYKND